VVVRKTFKNDDAQNLSAALEYRIRAAKLWNLESLKNFLENPRGISYGLVSRHYCNENGNEMSKLFN
jgi:hypothetical protein